MEIQRNERQEIINRLRSLKNGKQPGPDGTLWYMLDSETCLKILEKCFNCVLCWGSPPEYWRKSRTVMIPKTKQPKAKEFRPIALTNVEYKIFMNVVKKKNVQHEC